MEIDLDKEIEYQVNSLQKFILLHLYDYDEDFIKFVDELENADLKNNASMILAMMKNDDVRKLKRNGSKY